MLFASPQFMSADTAAWSWTSFRSVCPVKVTALHCKYQSASNIGFRMCCVKLTQGSNIHLKIISKEEEEEHEVWRQLDLMANLCNYNMMHWFVLASEMSWSTASALSPDCTCLKFALFSSCHGLKLHFIHHQNWSWMACVWNAKFCLFWWVVVLVTFLLLWPLILYREHWRSFWPSKVRPIVKCLKTAF